MEKNTRLKILLSCFLISIGCLVLGYIVGVVHNYLLNEEAINLKANSRSFNYISEAQIELNDVLDRYKNTLHIENKDSIGGGDNNTNIIEKSTQDDRQIIFPTGYINPDSLELVYLKGAGLYYTQTQEEHFARNGYIAYDMTDTTEEHVNLYAPSYMYIDENGKMRDEERTYVVNLKEQVGTTGLTIVLSWKENRKYGVENTQDIEWNIGHIYETDLKDGDIVKTGDVIGKQGGCIGSLKLDEASTGCHAHIEIRQGGAPIFYPIGKTLHGEELKRYKKYKELKNNEEARKASGDYSVDATTYEKYPVNFKLLQAIHSLENGQKIKNCATSIKGARGCFQFMEGTFKNWACDGGRDGTADVDNFNDSLCTANAFVNHLVTFYRTKHPNTKEENIWFKVLYSYNAGYALRDGSAIRINNDKSPRADNGIPGAVNYALKGLEIINNL